MKNFALFSLAAVIVLGSGCNQSAFSGKKSADSAANGNIEFGPSGPNPVTDTITVSKNTDIIIALDSSGSMDEERLAISANLNLLILALQKGSLEPRIHIIAGRQESDDGVPVAGPILAFPAEVDAAKVAVVAEKIGSHDALGHVTLTLTGAYASSYESIKGLPMNPPLAFRPDAKLEVLVISDDNGINGEGTDKTMTGNTAQDFDPANKFKATINGVIGTPTSVQVDGVCEIDGIGQEYIALAGRTGGSILDICTSDWSKITERFTADVLKRSQSILLSKVPVDPAKIQVALGGQILPKDAWTYDPSTRLVTLSPTITVTAGLQLVARYDAF